MSSPTRRDAKKNGTVVDLPQPPKEGDKVIAGFHCVQLSDGRCDVALLNGTTAQQALSLLGLATIKIHDIVRDLVASSPAPMADLGRVGSEPTQ